jgi:FolB domain-containing protein
MDRIIISDLRARCIIGLNPEERREKQDVVVNLVIVADLRRAGRSDRFEDTVDYRQIKKAVLERVEASQFLLLEALAQAIADTCLADSKVQRVRVRVDKPSALRFARSVAVQITRSRAAQDDQP